MNHKIILLSFLLLSFLSFSQTKVDSLEYLIRNVTEDQNLINEEFENLALELRNSNRLNDSLEKQLVHYKVKEDYFAAALGEQATRFALIITGILALFGFLSYGVIKYELKKIQSFTNKKIAKQKKSFSKQTELFNKLALDFTKSSANLNLTVGFNHYEKSEYNKSLIFYLLGIGDMIKVSRQRAKEKLKKNKEADVSELFKKEIFNIQSAIDILKIIQITEDDRVKQDYLSNYDRLISLTDRIESKNYFIVGNKIAELRVLMNLCYNNFSEN